jgi:Protein of unknown function (DUF2442)
MKNIPSISQIIKVEPFKITCLWNTGEVLVSDFEYKFNSSDNYFQSLSDFGVFRQASVSELGTLQWQNVPVSLFFDGHYTTQPFDLDPEVLYEESQQIKKYKLVLEDILD